MRKKNSVILTLSVVFVTLLFFQRWKEIPLERTRFFDRLPEADVIGTANVLALSRSLSSSTYHFKVPFREFLTPEFILGQGKSFGVDFQQPAYIFANENDWMVQSLGAMFVISDSSAVRSGIEQLDRIIGLKDTVVYKKHVFKIEKYNTYIAYGYDWLLLYQGGDFKRIYHDILFAKINEIQPNWRSFLNQQPSGPPLIAKIKGADLASNGIESIYLTMSNDSTSITLNAEVNQIDTLPFQLVEEGWKYASQEFTRNSASLFITPERLRNNSNKPLVRLIKKIGVPINFPLKEFFDVWDGGVAFRQGGIQTITEKYIESILDDNFEVSEVVRSRKIKVPAYSLFISTNEKNEAFITQLLKKGILTRHDKKYRFLFSPPFNLKITDSSIVFHTGGFIPVLYENEQNKIDFTYNKTPYTLLLDSTSTKTAYGRLKIPLNQIVKDNILF
jgi:hypothetical protein